MKKYLLGLIAIVFAVGASAFVAKNHHTSNNKLNTYYWYSVNSSGQIVAGSQAYGGVKENVTYAEDNLPCPAGTDADCVRGFNNQITSFPTSATGDTSPLQKSN
jgi:hypothetical protein